MSRLPLIAALLAAALVASAPSPAQTPAPAAAAGGIAAPSIAAGAMPAPSITAGAIPAPSIAAAAHVLVDVTSGQTLEAFNADERRDPASLTKLMTAYLVFGALRAKTIQPSQMVNVSTRAWRAEGSRMFIEPRRAVTVDELMRGMIIQSGNDASIALAELVGGDEAAFIARMNAEAVRLRMTNTHFANVTGLTAPEHYSTAADMAKLAAAVINDYPEFYPLYSQKEYRYNNITQPNRNRLLWTDASVDGIKTGHTDAAGWCLIASAKHGERRVLAVVLGAKSDAARANEAQRLLNWGFQAFDTVQLYQSGKTIAILPVWKGTIKELPAGFLADRYLTLPKGKADKLSLAMDSPGTLIAPIARAQRVGTVKVALEGKPVAEFPLIALEEVPEAGFFGRAWDTIRLWFTRS